MSFLNISPSTSNQILLGALVRAAFFGLSLIGAVALWMLWSIAAKLPPADLNDLVKQHAAAWIGVPAAAALATFVIGIVCAITGPIEVDILGLRGKGAGAVVVLWIAIFLTAGLLIRVNW